MEEPSALKDRGPISLRIQARGYADFIQPWRIWKDSNPTERALSINYAIILPHIASRLVPEVPKEITGPCVYGHIITDEHRNHFRHLHPDIEQWESASPDALVSVASILHPRGCHIAVTEEVFYQDQWHTCLVHMNNKLYYGTIIDQRRPGQFMAAVEKELGITTKPEWYPCYVPWVQ